MMDTHHLRRVKLNKDAKIDKTFKLLMTFNEESKKHISAYKLNFQETKRGKSCPTLTTGVVSQEVQRRNRKGSSMNRHDRDNSAGSRARGSLNRDMTPNKFGK